MAYHAAQVRISYQNRAVIPPSDPDLIAYEAFKEQFGLDGNVMVVGIESDQIFQIEFFNDWYKLTQKISQNPKVRNVLSIGNLSTLVKDDSTKKFKVQPLVPKLPSTQAELDSLKIQILNAKLYEGLLFNPETNATLLAITIEPEILLSEARKEVVTDLVKVIEAFSTNHDVDVHYSGLPYIRNEYALKVAGEMKLFSLLALLITAVCLFLFFRTGSAVFIPVLVVAMGAIWSLGLMHILGYQISLLTALIPPLVVVIGIPNCVYLLTKYHDEYRKHKNKIKALTRIIEKIGVATLITNVTTAIGFGVFYITGSAVLKEFGLITSTSIVFLFFASIIIIPTIFSLLPSPSERHTKHLENNNISSIISFMERLVSTKRKWIFGVTSIVIVLALVGLMRLKAQGYILDDLPKGDELLADLRFFERNFKGVMPVDILIDTGKKNGAINLNNLRIADEIQKIFTENKTFSKPISIVEALKTANQAFYNGSPTRYVLPNNQEKNFVLPYLTKLSTGSDKITAALTDSNRQIIRISFNMEDVGTARMNEIMPKLQVQVDSLIIDTDLKVSYTGTSLIFLKGNQYLINSLVSSLSLAFLLIAIIMGVRFRSFRMMLLSLIPNVLPLLITAAIMGYFNINLKPSTVLIFSIAFGIAVDDTIHFLTKYKQELERHNWDVQKTAIMALKETANGMIYTSIILFFGFIIFTASNFGGTIALGMLTSLTLIVAMISNLVLLPALLIAFDRKPKSKFFKT